MKKTISKPNRKNTSASAQAVRGSEKPSGLSKRPSARRSNLATRMERRNVSGKKK